MPSRGYDMTPTMYSPDGRIYQVEYAIETVKRGTLAVGIKGIDGVVLAVEEKPRKLQIEEIPQKIFRVDDHIGVAAAGYIPDARNQVDDARFFSQSNRMIYDEPVEVETVAKHVADQCLTFTQYAGVRPYGVALIIAGFTSIKKALFCFAYIGNVFEGDTASDVPATTITSHELASVIAFVHTSWASGSPNQTTSGLKIFPHLHKGGICEKLVVISSLKLHPVHFILIMLPCSSSTLVLPAF